MQKKERDETMVNGGRSLGKSVSFIVGVKTSYASI